MFSLVRKQDFIFGELSNVMAESSQVPPKIINSTWKKKKTFSPLSSQETSLHFAFSVMVLTYLTIKLNDWHQTSKTGKTNKQTWGEMTGMASMLCQITHSFQLSSLSGAWIPPQAFHHPVGKAPWHGLSSDRQKKKNDHLQYNSCLPLQSLGLTVFLLDRAQNWTHDMATCCVIASDLFPCAQFSCSLVFFCVISHDKQKVQVGAL